MANFDAYSRGLRGDGGPNYYETYETYEPYNPYGSNRHMPAYPTSTSKYTGEPRDIPYAPPSASSVPPPPPPPPPPQQSQSSYPSSNNMGMPYDSDRPSARENHDGVSPDIIAAITEKVKRELLETLKQSGNFNDHPRASSMQRDHSSSTNQSPPPSDRRKVYTPPSPTSTTRPSFSPPPTEPMRSPPASPISEKPSVRFSDRSGAHANGKPQTIHRSYSTTELSTIDQKWGRLFDSEGQPTERLGQFLRGLANYIVDDFAPKKSIVITPLKMAAYYGDHPIDREIHPYTSIFKSSSNAQISKLYQDLGCQHHLVQDDNNSAPTIPALTPLGFAHWMTIQISAYPDGESKRLEKVVLALPINADGPMVDGKPERLPKQISRHLLPNTEDRESQKLLKTAINRFFDESGISPSRSKPTASSPPLRQTSPAQSQSRPVDISPPRASQSASTSKPIERERMPYTGAPSVVSESSSTDDTSGPKLERERKPYTAQPGSGKFHTEPTNLYTATNRPSRANSTTRPKDTPERERSREPNHKRTQSNASQDNYKPPPLSSTKRNRSPQLKSHSQSTPNNINISSSNYAPPSAASFPPTFATSYSTSTSFPPPPSATSEPSHTRDRRRDDRFLHRRGTDDERFSTYDFTSPRDAEKWDRLHERGSLSDYDPRDGDRGDKSSTTSSYETRSTVIEPNNYEDWYRGSSTSSSVGDGSRAGVRHSSYGRYNTPGY
ncbi:hypothetical protein ACMFMG_002856 [Clarireedia jacksonii]